MNQETWKDVDGFEGLYTISRQGAVYSTRKGILLSQARNNNGYRQVLLVKNGKGYNRRIHRMVADAFLPNPGGLGQVNHKDGNKDNNHADNLEWCDQHHNMAHAARSGLLSYAKSVIALSLETGEEKHRFPSLSEAVRSGFGPASSLRRAIGRDRLGHCGLMWRFA